MTHLFILIALIAFIFGLITRAGRLHRQYTQTVISLYVVVSIALYLMAWQEVSEDAYGRYARLWIHNPLLGAATAIEFGVCLWLGKAVASYYVHHIRLRLAVHLLRAQLAIRQAEREGRPPPRGARVQLWVIRRLVNTRQQPPSSTKGDR